MKLNNTLTRSTEKFTPANGDTVTLYSCGPTVYSNLTIGNWMAYIRWDILARTLKASDYDLKWYMNITDVGHLVSDADDGEDKLEKGARLEGVSAWQIAQKYTEDFIKGLKALHIDFDLRNLVKATDHIAEQINLIKTLDQKGFTYVLDDGVYFDSTKFPSYGAMARLDLKGQQAGARVDIGQKKHASDFALWKFSPKDKTRDMEWESPWGKGFPGWHIECSAMSMKYLGETIDIHTGGIDHIPVHHTNEIAQSEAVTGKQFVRFWLHGNFLKVDGQKISKSLGNGYTLRDIVDKRYSPLDFKMLALQSHYQTEANFTFNNLDAARVRRQSYTRMADYLLQPVFNDQDSNLSSEFFEDISNKILSALQDNLDTPTALMLLSKAEAALTANNATFTNTAAVKSCLSLLQKVDKWLGIELLAGQNISSQQKLILQKREAARSNKDWAASDSLRDSLLEQGIALKDTPEVPYGTELTAKYSKFMPT